ncbi:Copia protein [Vitis vinifera]|uniref:Copia protein n=1 Tax=Vitis vinifera TaxID=29760 RepID=A0A438CND1_VITVI|nr:Copia protein [Vitis vinifera]
MTLGLCEALWLKLLLQDLGYLSRQPIRLFCDNKAACDIAHNPVQHDRTKHVEVDRFFIKEKLDDKIVELPKIRSKDQLADILTKAVSIIYHSKASYHVDMIELHYTAHGAKHVDKNQVKLSQYLHCRWGLKKYSSHHQPQAKTTEFSINANGDYNGTWKRRPQKPVKTRPLVSCL